MNYRFTDNAAKAISAAIESAKKRGHTYIGTEHLLIGLLTGSSVAAKLTEAKGANLTKISEAIDIEIGTGEPLDNINPEPTPRFNAIIESSAVIAKKSGQSFIGTEHLLAALLDQQDSMAIRLLKKEGVNTRELLQETISVMNGGVAAINDIGTKNSSGSSAKENGSFKDTPTLNQYGTDLTKLAREGAVDPFCYQ